MSERLEVQVLTTPSSCKNCYFYKEQPEFGHALCRRHRACFEPTRYVPQSCDICTSLKESWDQDPISGHFHDWKQVLRKIQKNLKTPWSYAQTATQFFCSKETPSSSSRLSRRDQFEQTPASINDNNCTPAINTSSVVNTPPAQSSNLLSNQMLSDRIDKLAGCVESMCYRME